MAITPRLRDLTDQQLDFLYGQLQDLHDDWQAVDPHLARAFDNALRFMYLEMISRTVVATSPAAGQILGLDTPAGAGDSVEAFRG